MMWLPLRCMGTRYVMHLISQWRSPVGQDIRFEARCGRVDADKVDVEDGELWCVACLEIAADEEETRATERGR